MSDVNPLAFQYQLRAYTLGELRGDDRRLADEQRDRELEDFLGVLDNRTTKAAAAVASLQAGTATINLSGSATGTTDITFPQPFDATPAVVVSANNVDYNAIARNRDVNGFTIDIRHIDNTAATASIVVDWIAKG